LGIVRAIAPAEGHAAGERFTVSVKGARPGTYQRRVTAILAICPYDKVVVVP
jgi:hypothetical protein